MAFLSALVLFNVVLYVGALQNLDMPLIKNIFPSSKFGSPNLSPFNMAFDVASFKDNMVMQQPMALEKNSLHLPAAAPRWPNTASAAIQDVTAKVKFSLPVLPSAVELQKKFPQLSPEFFLKTFATSSKSAAQEFSPLISPTLSMNTSLPVALFPTLDKAVNSPGSLSGVFGKSKPENVEKAKEASTLERVAKTVSTELKLPRQNVSEVLAEVSHVISDSHTNNCSTPLDSAPAVSLDNPFAIDGLPACVRTKYRTHSGHCNNPAFATWGEESSLFSRLLQAEYADGISVARIRGTNNLLLPSARLVSSSLIGTDLHLAPTWTNMFMQFGQFLDHDLTHTPQTQLSQEAPKCCGVSLNTSHPQCFPIEIPATDKFYSKFDQRCMEFVRSLPGARPGCALGPREQINQVTAFIDGNQIYGSTKEQADSLREHQNGFLKSSRPFPSREKYTLLPADPSSRKCSDGTPTTPCFDAGDGRVNVQVGLEVVHTIFMRQHNRMAERLRNLHRLDQRSWDDQKLYQEARAIVAAQLQHIVFNEWLPILLGQSTMASSGLALMTSGRFVGYNISQSPAIFNVFATAAFRVGHSMVTGRFSRLRADRTSSNVTSETMKDTFFQCGRLYQEDFLDETVLGLTSDLGKMVDSNVVADLSQQLFHSEHSRFGLDLVSLNIQRGRDHGLAGYMKWRRFCKLTTATTFEELKSLAIFPDNLDFSRIYQNVEDIDLYPAGISEIPLNDGIIGPTFSCIIRQQFLRLRTADRFWYELDLPLNSTLTDDQLTEIRKTTLAGIICDTIPSVQFIQLKVFQPISASNPLLSCEKIASLNLEVGWK